MIPLVSISNFIDFLFYLFVSLKLYSSYNKTRNRFVLLFLKSFAFLTAFFFIISFPGLVTLNPTAIGLIFLSSYILVLLATAHFIVIPLGLLGWRKIEKIILFGIALSLIFTIYKGVAGFHPAASISEGGIIFWIPTILPLVRVFISLVIGILGLGFIIFFIISGVKSEDRRILTRSIIVGSAMLVLITASFINYLGGAAPSPFTMLLSSVFASLSALIFLASVNYKVSQKT